MAGRSSPARTIALPGAAFLLSAAATAATLLAWAVFLTGPGVLAAAYAPGIVALIWLALGAEARHEWRAPDLRALAGRAHPAVAGAAVAVTAAGTWYRLAAWPALRDAGDSRDYAGMAAAALAAGRYVITPWRTPGYAFFLAAVERLAGPGGQAAVHLAQVVLSMATALLVLAIVRMVTRSWALALLAVAVSAVAWPMAVASAFLMTEALATFLATLVVALALAIHAGRHTGAAALALGPAAALACETRPALLPWVAVAGAAALVAPRLLARQRLVLALGVLLTLAPVVAINAHSVFRVVTPGPVVDLVPENLATDRFSLYWTAPDSPAQLDRLYAGIVADGGDTDSWLTVPPARVASLTGARMRLIERSILADPLPYVQLSLRRAPLFYRYDQPWDMTYPAQLTAAQLVVVDLLLALAVLGTAASVARRDWRTAGLVAAPVAVLTGTLALFHVEPRYSLPALPAMIALAMAGLGALGSLLRPLRRRPRLAAGAAAAAAMVAAVVVAEAWAWPALAGGYAPAPRPGRYEVASCSVGHQLLTAVAWQPGTALVVAGGANGMATWDAGSGACRWTYLNKDDVWDLGFSRDGTRLAVGSYHARIVDVGTWTPYRSPPGGRPVSGIGTEMLSASLDGGGGRLAFAATGLHFAGVYDAASRAVVARVDLAASPVAVRWSPDGGRIAVATADGRVGLYDAGLRPEAAVRLPGQPTALAWSPSGLDLAAGDAAGRVRVLDASRPGLPVVASRLAHPGGVRGLAYSPDGRSLASAGADRTARIWDAGGLVETRLLAGDTAAVWAVAWSADSSRVVTASADGSLGLWTAR